MSGLLDYFANNARNLWGEIQRAPQDIKGLFSPEFAQQVKAQMKQPVSISPEQAANTAMDYMQVTPAGGLLGAIKVFHGSPHKFNKFNMSKIGTGEGAQAYGHGLYFAENPSVAEDYAKTLGDFNMFIDGKPFNADDLTHQASLDVFAQGGDKWKAVKALQQDAQDLLARNKDWATDIAKQKIARADWIAAQSQIPKYSEQSLGNLYETSLRWPDAAREAADPLGPQHFLDWDKPLSANVPQEVKDAFNTIIKKYPDLKDSFFQAFKDGKPGYHYYSLLNDYAKFGDLAKNQAFASNTLKEAGIPGIRYLDGMSRGAGEGSSNFVVFSDDLAEIIKRNGQPITGLLK